MAFLIQANEGVRSVVIPLGRALILIGRDADSNLYLNDSGISKNHASIVFSNESYFLRDNGSTNGSFVNGIRVKEHKLAHDDTIQFGPYLFKVDLVNPIPVTTHSDQAVQLERSGNSYTRQLELAEIAGRENTGHLRVVMTDSPKTLPLPLPPHGFLSGLSVEERQNLSLRGIYRYSRSGEIMIQEGLNPGRLFLLISGKWEARKGEANTVLGQIQPGDWVGEVNIFDPAGALCSVVSVEPSEYWEITREAFEKFINESRATGSAILIALAATLGRRIRQSTDGLQQAIDSRPDVPKSKSSRLVPLFAALAVIGLLGAAAFFFTGTADKNRLEAENQLLEQTRVETLEEARQRLEALQASLQSTKAELQQAKAQNLELSKNLDATKEALKTAREASVVAAAQQTASQPTPPTPVNSKPAPEASPADSREAILAKAASLSGFPAKVIITKKTTVELSVDGKVSGSAVLPEGIELPVIGVDGHDVIVEFGDAHRKISKENTNFAEALIAEVEAEKNKSESRQTASSSIPKPSPTPAKTAESSILRKKSDKESSKDPVAEISDVLEEVELLETLEGLPELHTATNSEVARFLRPLESRWRRAAREAARLLADEERDEAQKKLLRSIVEASEMLDPSRLAMFEAKLRDIDRHWITIKTDWKIQKINESTPASGDKP